MNRRYRKTIIAGNWKMNKTSTEAKKFADDFKALLPKTKWCDVRAERGHFRRRARL